MSWQLTHRTPETPSGGFSVQVVDGAYTVSLAARQSPTPESREFWEIQSRANEIVTGGGSFLNQVRDVVNEVPVLAQYRALRRDLRDLDVETRRIDIEIADVERSKADVNFLLQPNPGLRLTATNDHLASLRAHRQTLAKAADTLRLAMAEARERAVNEIDLVSRNIANKNVERVHRYKDSLFVMHAVRMTVFEFLTEAAAVREAERIAGAVEGFVQSARRILDEVPALAAA
jgi:hypothetical protein